MKQRFFYCPKCGGSLGYRDYEERKRLTCFSCGYIFYENPVVVAAIVPTRRGASLGRRNSSYRGLWCILRLCRIWRRCIDAVVRSLKRKQILDKINGVYSAVHSPQSRDAYGGHMAGGGSRWQIEGTGWPDRVEYFELFLAPAGLSDRRCGDRNATGEDIHAHRVQQRVKTFILM